MSAAEEAAAAPGEPPFIVALGASAGGLEAIERFFSGLSPQTGMTFVVIQHLSPDFKSLMDDILSRRTAMAVRVAEEDAQLEPNTVFLNPPKKLLTIRAGRLHLSDKEPSPAISYPIDHFFQHLAAEARHRCAAIVLSGTGSDGSRGVIEIHRAGGLVIAQDPTTAGFDGMPQAAIETGHADLVLAPEEMPEALGVFRDEGRVTARAEPLPATGLDRVMALLRDACGVDFTQYKLPTITRRTDRRIKAVGDPDLDAYVARLAADPHEVDLLYRDLLIGVTQFFRDAEAFERLAALLPALLHALPPGEELRAWVAGCASGEEAYSIAILVREALDQIGQARPVKIFATDVHREALRLATAGVYDEASLTSVSPARRARFFTAHGSTHYQVTPELRAMVVFAPHDVLQDVPFNKLDLVSCRNLLIYLQPPAQRHVIEVLQFGLRPHGLLFLGASESLADLAGGLEVVDSHWKLFRKISHAASAASHLRATANTAPLRTRPLPAVPTLPRPPDPDLLGTYDALLDAVAPASLVIDARRNLVQTFGGASRYLHVPEGRATRDAAQMLSEDLRVAVTGALQRVFAEHTPVRYLGLRAGGDTLVDITVREIVNRRTNEPYAVVTFEAEAAAPAAASPAVPIDQLSRDQIAALERELRLAKENLQTTIEELATSNEELQATNEELVASNEELQTTNEELHSVNQELFTVNSELQRKIAELTQLTTDMDLLLTSTQVHTLFLDRELCIRRFTPLIAEVFHLVPGDLGRRIDGFNHSLRAPSVYAEIHKVIATGAPFEQQVRGASVDDDARDDAPWFLLRILPYRRGQATEGAVLTLVDITNLKRFEHEAQIKRDQLSSILTNSPDPLWIRDHDGRYVVTDVGFRSLAGRDPIGLRPDQVFSADVAAMLVRDDAHILGQGATVKVEETIPTPGGPRTFLSVKFPMRDPAGQRWGIGGIQTEVTAIKRAEAEAREAATRRDHFLATLSHELRNPLAAILNASRVLDHGGLPADEIARWHGVVLERAQHMTRLVDDLLDVARLTQNKLVLQHAELDLASLIRGVVDETAPELRERGVQLETRAEDGLVVRGDATRLHQLQVNLLTNAARHSPAGGTIRYTLRRDGDAAELCVADDGSGIAPEMLERIFELFVQGERPGARGEDGGLGVGLALVRRIAELHGGTAAAQSAGPGKGAVFRVRIPLVPAAAGRAARGGTAAPAPAPQDAAAQRPRSALLVEDDATNLSAMAKLLELDGVDVVAAQSGPQALAHLEAAGLSRAPELVLLDLGLPGMNGLEACRRMRALPGGAALLILALTGFGQDSDREATQRAGFDGHLTKPVDIEEIYALYARCRAERRGAVS